jgi:hypothetical protein
MLKDRAPQEQCGDWLSTLAIIEVKDILLRNNTFVNVLHGF